MKNFVAVIATDETMQQLQEMNLRGRFDLERLTERTINALQKKIEKNATQYTHLILEVAAIRHSDVGAAIDLLERLQKTTAARLIVLMQDYAPDSAAVQDVQSIGIKDVLTDKPLWLRKRLQEILYEDPRQEAGTNGPSFCISPEQDEPAAEPGPPREEPPVPAAPPQSYASVPPSAITRQAAKKFLLPKRPISQPTTNAITIAFAGAGSRMGTTTQAVQMLLFLVANGYTAALIEMSDRSVLSEYLANPELCPEHYKVRGLDFYRTRSSLLAAKKQYQYVVLDYGEFECIPDITSFMEKDFKVICSGVKPQESARLAPVFEADDDSLMYCFSFVPPADAAEVRELMKGRKIYFAPPAPDYWTYTGEDEIYQTLLDLNKKD